MSEPEPSEITAVAAPPSDITNDPPSASIVYDAKGLKKSIVLSVIGCPSVIVAFEEMPIPKIAESPTAARNVPAAAWVESIKLARRLLRATGSVENAVAILKAVEG